MFTGQAEAALALYAEGLRRFPPAGNAAPSGRRRCRRAGRSDRPSSCSVAPTTCADSLDVHDFTFSPSISLFVECSGAEQFEPRRARAGRGGHWLMPVRRL
jgi:predicted 3-demethylubiquinone-9 3-methyltransferase (glyoxalase superfamily)